ncbi:methyl-accepting chemotaxis protein [Aneurinibacillus tyrosinisolvens]|uniref:methyl-accepting chemotaxis protein n=1 Tax=Aneurinibacillus tyrosinisolvens TaxID=1443435 RepID=UPI00063F02C6|nr:methyl-accepting chemotaxis protein [Aneurinibacillus tyrosinisolvens]
MKSIRTAIVGMTLVLTLVIFSLQSAFSFYEFKKIATQGSEEKLRIEADKIAKDLDKAFSHPADISESLALYVSQTNAKDIDKVNKYMLEAATYDKLIVGLGFWMEYYAYNPQKKLYPAYVSKKEDGTPYVNISYDDGKYDYTNDAFYKLAKEMKRIQFTNPYADPITKIPMVSAVTPILNNKGEFNGSTTIDIGLQEIEKYVAGLKIGQQGYAFIVSRDGYYLGHKNNEKNMKVKITEEKDAAIKSLGEQLVKANKLEMTTCTIDGKDSYVTYAPIGETGMKVVTVLPKAEVVQPVNSNLLTSAIVFLIAMAVFAAILHFFVNRKLIYPIRQLVGITNRVSAGDLSEETMVVKSKDEIGQLTNATNTMIQNLRNIVVQVSQSSEQVAASAEQLSASAEQTGKATEQIALTVQEVAAGTDKQMQSVDESSRTIGELAVGVQKIAENAQHVTGAAADTSGRAEEGAKNIQLAIKQMSAISNTFGNLSDSVKALGERSNQISQIVQVITDISSQTNLLALNAAIEAARAGEHGKGFAVVADEVRKLAEQSSNSAQQIGQLIAAIQEETNKTVQSMDNATKEVAEGIGVVNLSGETFERIQHSVNEVASQIEQVSSAAQQISAATEQVVHSIQLISEVAEDAAAGTQNVSAATEEQLASMEEISASASSLTSMAEELQEAIGKFKV